MHGERDVRVPGGHTAWEVLGAYVPQLLSLLCDLHTATDVHTAIDARTATDLHTAIDAHTAAGGLTGEPYDIAMVSHGAVIRLVSQFLGGVNPDWALASYLRNAQFVELDPSGVMARVSASQGQSLFTPERLIEWEDSMTVISWGEHGVPELRN